MRLWFSLLAALLLTPVALGYTIFSTRSTSVSCARVDGHVNCSEREHIGPYDVWAKRVANIAIARDMSGSSEANGVVAETESGEQIQLTSTFLDENQQAAIADRIHQFIFVQRDQDTLAFDLPPSLINIALGGGFTAALAIGALVTAVQLGRRLLAGRAS
jgi:hypothetical protein